MSFKNQSVFSSVYTNTTFTITEDMQLSEVVIELQSGSATLLGGLRVPGLTLDPVAITVGQPVVLNADSGYTLTDITVDSTAGGVFEIYGTYGYIDAVDASAAAYFTATGITGATQQAAINNLVKSLKGYGLWSKMKAIYPFVTDNYNLLNYTEDFLGSSWVRLYCTITANTTTAPDGTLTADTLTQTSNDGRVEQTISSTSTQVTESIYVKGNASSIGKISTLYIWRDGGSEIATKNITLTADWQRIEFTKTFTVTPSTITFRIDAIENGVIGDSAYIWGAQLEVGSTATTYQPILTTQQAFISNQFKYNLKDPRDLDAAFRLVFNGGWTFSSSGATPNGVNAYADTKLIPSSNFTSDNNISLGYYTRNFASGGITLTGEMGSANLGLGNGVYLIIYYNVTGQSVNRVASNTSQLFSISPIAGFYSLSRTTSANFKYFRNSVLLDTPAITSSGRTSNSMWIGGVNYGTSAEYGQGQCAFSFIGDGLTDTEATNFYIAVQTYQEALSRQVGVPVVSDPNAQAFIDAAQITDVTQADAINNLVLGLKYDNLWNKMTAIYPFVGGTATTHKYNLKDPRDLDAAYRLVFNGGWTHSSTGATPNGTNGYADTFLAPSVLGLNNIHLSYYSRTNNVTASPQVEIGRGTLATGTYSNAFLRLDSTTNEVGGTFGSRNANSIVSNSTGYVINTSNSVSQRGYKNGLLFATNTTTQTGTATTSTLYIGSQGNSVNPAQYSSRQSAFSTIGTDLTDADASNLYNRVQTYQTTLGRQVS